MFYQDGKQEKIIVSNQIGFDWDYDDINGEYNSLTFWVENDDEKVSYETIQEIASLSKKIGNGNIKDTGVRKYSFSVGDSI